MSSAAAVWEAMVSTDAAGVKTALKVSDHDGLPKVGLGHQKSASRDAARKTVSAEASPHDKRARSASQEYVTPEDRASQKRKQPDMTPKKVRKLPRPQVHRSEELAWPEKHPEPQKQSREARTSSALS